MSNTPRTDSSVVETDWLGTRVELVNADFARKLERENAALRKELELVQKYSQWHKESRGFLRELEVRKESDKP